MHGDRRARHACHPAPGRCVLDTDGDGAIQRHESIRATAEYYLSNARMPHKWALCDGLLLAVLASFSARRTGER
ncbi:hypothetical protein GCM10019016_111960 [Streptomyces prasinosporus]|uniref:Uncharacterized protein n=1 Tax=Streptomyces prasinosporus TaxID=68256 RepID=A0ABP6UBH9_9ACTN|nr:hypothetical protein GCM10010332_23940 [Streptomyces albogriseolus]